MLAGRRHRPGSPRVNGQALALLTTAGDPDGVLAGVVIDSLPLAVIVVDDDAGELLSNPAARALGILKSGFLANDRLVDLCRTAGRAGVEQHCELDLPSIRIGHEGVAVAARAVPLAVAGRPSGTVALLLDDRTAARRVDATRRDFVANVSHELNTPVGALSLLAETLIDAADDPEAVQRFALRIKHESTRLAAMIHDLIELSRLQGAEAPAHVSAVDVGRVVDEVVDRARLAAAAASIEIAVGRTADAVIMADERQVITALANLVDNAIAYSAADSKIAIGVSNVEVDGRAMVDIAVSDGGIGIAAADQERVFERFYRVDPARSRATGGTGLGLAIVKHIATNHGGTVSVWSVEGTGSTFTIRLPAAIGAIHAGTENE
jgi:two-component system sensor histidine kinase SenX3